MRPIEALTQNDKDLINAYINDYADPTEVTRAPIEHILRVWDRNKQHLFDLLGGQLIKEIPLTYEKSESEMLKEVSELLYWDNYLDRLHKKAIEYGAESQSLWVLFSERSLATNRLRLDVSYTSSITKKTYKWQKDTKTMKALATLAKDLEMDRDEFEAVRIKHSQILNDRYLKGTLCLSIHPLDYMTMSDNCERWSSCMSWMDNGDYRRGTVECMNSEHLVLAYLKSDNNTLCNGWNSKKWRSLIVATPELLFSVKGYPYHNKDLAATALRTLSTDAYDEEVFNYNTDNKNGVDLCNRNKDHHIFVQYDFESVMYNDLGETDHLCMLSKDIINEYEEGQHNITLNFMFGGEVTCMCCGDIEPDFRGSNKLVCVDCGVKTRCSICGEIVDDDDYWTMDNGDICCNACYDEKFTEGFTIYGNWDTFMPKEDAVRIKFGVDHWRAPSLVIEKALIEDEESAIYFFGSSEFETIGENKVLLKDISKVSKTIYRCLGYSSSVYFQARVDEVKRNIADFADLPF